MVHFLLLHFLLHLLIQVCRCLLADAPLDQFLLFVGGLDDPRVPIAPQNIGLGPVHHLVIVCRS